MIAHQLPDEDLGSFRLTCHSAGSGADLEHQTRHATERNHCMSIYGLKGLAEITGDIKYGPLVRTVVFNVFWSCGWDHLLKCTVWRYPRIEAIEALETIFTNIQANQRGPITIGFSDNYPTIERVDCASADFYQYSEKPSYGWKQMMSNQDKNSKFSKRRRYRDGTNHTFLSFGEAAEIVLEIAIAKGCKISGLDLRIVGMFHNAPDRFFDFRPTVGSVVNRFLEAKQWDMRVIVNGKEDADFETRDIPMITFDRVARELTFRDYMLGSLNINRPFVVAYHIFRSVFHDSIKHLRLMSCVVVNANVFHHQCVQLFSITKDEHDKGFTGDAYPLLETINIRGLVTIDNRGWDKILNTFAQVKTLKKCSMQGMVAVPRVKEEEEEGGEENEQENGSGATPEEFDRLAESIALLNVDLDASKGDYVTEELEEMAARVPDAAKVVFEASPPIFPGTW